MNLHTQPSTRPAEASPEFQVTDWFAVTDRTKVIHKYWHALRIYLVCLLSRFPDYKGEMEDLLQDFIMKKVLQPGWLEMADPKKGRFRDFLKSSLRHFVTGELRKHQAEKRGGKSAAVPLDELELEPAGPEPVSASFDMAWLQMLLAEALEQMERSCAKTESQHVWRIFQTRLVQPALEGSSPAPYEELVAEFGFKSPAQATNALTTAKRMFARHLRTIVAQYETGDKAIRAEIDALRLFLNKLMPERGKQKQ